MLHFLAILAMIVGLVGSFFTYIGTMHYGSLTLWGVLAVVGILGTIFTRRPGN